MNRRDLLRACALAGTTVSFGGAVTASQNLVSARTAVDHLLLGAADLDTGIAWFERISGVKAAAGGSHPGVGTRNALVSLGGKQYLEIIAPDPAQKNYQFQIDIRSLAKPRLITWAAATADVNAVAKNAQEAGHRIFGPRDGARARPDGRILKWKTLGLLNKLGLDGVEPIPFFIEWQPDSLHPSQDSPKGCELESFEIEHSDAAILLETLKSLGIDTNVKQSKNSRLVATLRTPKGRVELS